MLVERGSERKEEEEALEEESPRPRLPPARRPMTRRPESRSGTRRARANPRRSEGSSGTLSAEEKKELLEFHRQAEMDKLRAEVRAAVEAERAAPGHKASSPKLPRTEQDQFCRSSHPEDLSSHCGRQNQRFSRRLVWSSSLVTPRAAQAGRMLVTSFQPSRWQRSRLC